MQSQLPEETARLKALMECRVLDTPPEDLFDQTARLAAYLCGTPIGLIGFIDATRHWFKSRVGWDHPEIPREHGITSKSRWRMVCPQIVIPRQDIDVTAGKFLVKLHLSRFDGYLSASHAFSRRQWGGDGYRNIVPHL